MALKIPGIHHITAIAGDPQRNVDFYTGLLGLRMVKLTVNFDDPGTYHFYYGDDAGSPGSILTFFPWPGAPGGKRGAGQATAIAFSIPEGALSFWLDRLADHGVAVQGPAARFGEQAITFSDPDGLALELIEHGGQNGAQTHASGAIGAASAIRGFHGVTLTERALDASASLLVAAMGLKEAGREGDRVRYQTEGDVPGGVVDILHRPDEPPGRVAVGTVHHVAFRTADDAEQARWRERIAGAGLDVTPVADRQYFRSIYFHEPGGVLFEIATDPPGFAIDEPPDSLGARLMLPTWLEAHREQIEASLPALSLPQAKV